MATATAAEVADALFVSEGDVRVVLEALVDPVPELLDGDLILEVSDVIDPWPLVRRVPDGSTGYGRGRR